MAADELPDGWRWLSTWDLRSGEEHTRCGPSGDYARLMKAANTQKIRAYKQASAWVIHVGDAMAFLKAANELFAAKHNVKPTAVADQSGVAEALKSIEAAVAFWGELISSRLEEIELNTRPK